MSDAPTHVEIYRSMRLILTLAFADLAKPHVPLVKIKLFAQSVFWDFISIHLQSNACPAVGYSQAISSTMSQGIYFVSLAMNPTVKFAKMLNVSSVIRPFCWWIESARVNAVMGNGQTQVFARAATLAALTVLVQLLGTVMFARLVIIK